MIQTSVSKSFVCAGAAPMCAMEQVGEAGEEVWRGSSYEHLTGLQLLDGMFHNHGSNN